MSASREKRGIDRAAILREFEQSDDPVLCARELAETFGVTRTAVNHHLQDLADAGELEQKHIGGNALAWWPAAGD